MNAARVRRLAAAVVGPLVVGALALGGLAACGSPARVQTLDDEPDLARIDGTIPDGFLPPVREELLRLNRACLSIDPEVRSEYPTLDAGRTLTLELIDAQCQWLEVPSRAPAVAEGRPRLIVGTLESARGRTVLDETTSVLDGERPVSGVGERAVFDLQTRTLYVEQNGRLWYLQLVGSAPGAAARPILEALGRSLVQTSAAR